MAIIYIFLSSFWRRYDLLDDCQKFSIYVLCFSTFIFMVCVLFLFSGSEFQLKLSGLEMVDSRLDLTVYGIASSARR